MTDAIKLGMHIQRVEPWMAALAAQQGHPWIKWVNPPEGGPNPAPGVPNHCVRFWHDPEQPRYIAGGEAGGRQYILDTLPRIRRVPWATCIELANEPDVNSNDGLRNLNLYSLGAMREAERHGLKLCILNLAQGNPGATAGAPEGPRESERWKLAQLAPCVTHAAQNGHWVGLHTYWLRNRGIEPLSRWHSLGRAEWNVEQWFDLGVPRSLKVLINENGVDGLINHFHPHQSWRSLSTLQEYARDVGIYEARARQLPWLESQMLFTVGYLGEWADYDHEEQDMRTIFAALPVPVAQPAPVIPPPRPTVPVLDFAVTRRRFATIEEFERHVQGLQIHEPYSRVVIHHTYRPTTERWMQLGGEHWIGTPTRVGSLEATYRARGWTRFPHVFVAPDGIWELGNLALDGAGVAGQNKGVRHIEIVGNYTHGVPEGATLTNAVGAAASLLRRIGGDESELVHHRGMGAATACPGNALAARFDWFKGLVTERLGLPPMIDERALGNWMQQHVLPQNPNAALTKYARARGWQQLSGEYDWYGLRAQVWVSPNDGRQRIVFCRIGDWGNVGHFEVRG